MILRNEKCDNSYHCASFTLRLCEWRRNDAQIPRLWCSIPPSKSNERCWRINAWACLRVPRNVKKNQPTNHCKRFRRARKASTRITILCGCSKANEFNAIEMHRSERVLSKPKTVERKMNLMIEWSSNGRSSLM